MADIDLAELKRLREAATPGPWFVGRGVNGDPQDTMCIWPDADGVGALIARTGGQLPWEGWFEQPAKDAAFIKAVENQLPALLSRIESLEAALKKLANAADAVGVMYFDSDDMSPEVTDMQEATLEARAALRSPSTEEQ